MKIRKLLLMMILALCCAGMIFAGGTQDEPLSDAAEPAQAADGKAPPVPLTVVDALGRTVTLEKPAERLAFTHYSSSETLKILDAWDLAVAKDGYSSDNIVLPRVTDLPVLNNPMDGPYNLNMETLLEVAPDLLILELIPMPGVEELIIQLEGIVPVITVKTYEPGLMDQSFRNLGLLLDRSAEAEAFLSWTYATRDMLLDKTGKLSDSEKTSLFYKTGWTGVDDLQTFSDEMSYVPSRNEAAGCINVAADLPSQGGWVPKVDPEWMVSHDYEVLLIGDPLPGAYGSNVSSTDGLASYRQQVMELPIFAESSAVKNDDVYMLGSEFFGTPRHIVGFVYIAKWCHPDLFTDMNPTALHQEYIDKFLRVDLDLSKQGVFVYPELQRSKP